MEHWKSLYDLYEISDQGNIRTISTGRMLSTKRIGRSNGYCNVTLIVDGKQITKAVHRLVAETFIDNPEHKTQVHHKNKDRSNNSVDNLEWVTPKEHAAKDRANRTRTKHHDNWVARQNMSY